MCTSYFPLLFQPLCFVLKRQLFFSYYNILCAKSLWLLSYNILLSFDVTNKIFESLQLYSCSTSIVWPQWPLTFYFLRYSLSLILHKYDVNEFHFVKIKIIYFVRFGREMKDCFVMFVVIEKKKLKKGQSSNMTFEQCAVFREARHHKWLSHFTLKFHSW